MRDMLVRHGIEPGPDPIERMPEALEEATLANAGLLRERGYELPGARAALAVVEAVRGRATVVRKNRA